MNEPSRPETTRVCRPTTRTWGHACLAMLVTALWASAALAAPPITLDKGVLRVDIGPPDFAYMDHGRLNDGRGLRLFKPGSGDLGVGVGAGAAYGVTETFELGGLLLPLQLAPDADLGGLEVYGRFLLTGGGDMAVAAQITIQLPTNADFALGLGAPIEVALSKSVRLQTGGELEIVFDPSIISLDIPAALAFDVGRSVFLGPRSGLFFDDFKELTVNLGAHIGGRLGGGWTLTGSFNWPIFLDTRGSEALNVDFFELIIGMNYRMKT